MRTGIRSAILVTIALASTACVSRIEIEAEADTQFEQMRQEIPLSTDARQKAYVFCVSRAIIQQLEPPFSDYDWEIEVFDVPQVNAFAMPGGNIGVFSGIFDVAKNSDQLAAVIGHEVAHVTEEHSLERANREEVTGMGVLVAGGVVGGSTGLGAGNATYGLDMITQLGLSLPFSRGQESEADVVGLNYMAGAGFDPRASVELWKNMAALGEAAPPEFLSTHPSSDNRIGDLVGNLPVSLVLYNQALAEGGPPDCNY